MYQIWIPGAGAPDAVNDVGLSELTRQGESGPACTPYVDKGPDGGPGLLVEYFGNTGRWGQSTWEPCWHDGRSGLPAGRFWWGFPPGQSVLRLRPETLAYQDQRKGFLVELADGQEWRLPNMVALPHHLTLDPATGEVTRKIKPDWKGLYNKMVWAFDLCAAAIKAERLLYRDECCDYLAEILAVNYRVNRELCYRLDLFDDDNWEPLVGLTVDRDRLTQVMQEVQQKKTLVTRHGSQPGVGPKA